MQLLDTQPAVSAADWPAYRASQGTLVASSQHHANSMALGHVYVFQAGAPGMSVLRNQKSFSTSSHYPQAQANPHDDQHAHDYPASGVTNGVGSSKITGTSVMEHDSSKSVDVISDASPCRPDTANDAVCNVASSSSMVVDTTTASLISTAADIMPDDHAANSASSSMTASCAVQQSPDLTWTSTESAFSGSPFRGLRQQLQQKTDADHAAQPEADSMISSIISDDCADSNHTSFASEAMYNDSTIQVKSMNSVTPAVPATANNTMKASSVARQQMQQRIRQRMELGQSILDPSSSLNSSEPFPLFDELFRDKSSSQPSGHLKRKLLRPAAAAATITAKKQAGGRKSSKSRQQQDTSMSSVKHRRTDSNSMSSPSSARSDGNSVAHAGSQAAVAAGNEQQTPLSNVLRTPVGKQYPGNVDGRIQQVDDSLDTVQQQHWQQALVEAVQEDPHNSFAGVSDLTQQTDYRQPSSSIDISQRHEARTATSPAGCEVGNSRVGSAHTAGGQLLRLMKGRGRSVRSTWPAAAYAGSLGIEPQSGMLMTSHTVMAPASSVLHIIMSSVPRQIESSLFDSEAFTSHSISSSVCLSTSISKGSTSSSQRVAAVMAADSDFSMQLTELAGQPTSKQHSEAAPASSNLMRWIEAAGDIGELQQLAVVYKQHLDGKSVVAAVSRTLQLLVDHKTLRSSWPSHTRLIRSLLADCIAGRIAAFSPTDGTMLMTVLCSYEGQLPGIGIVVHSQLSQQVLAGLDEVPCGLLIELHHSLLKRRLREGAQDRRGRTAASRSSRQSSNLPYIASLSSKFQDSVLKHLLESDPSAWGDCSVEALYHLVPSLVGFLEREAERSSQSASNEQHAAVLSSVLSKLQHQLAGIGSDNTMQLVMYLTSPDRDDAAVSASREFLEATAAKLAPNTQDPLQLMQLLVRFSPRKLNTDVLVKRSLQLLPHTAADQKLPVLAFFATLWSSNGIWKYEPYQAVAEAAHQRVLADIGAQAAGCSTTSIAGSLCRLLDALASQRHYHAPLMSAVVKWVDALCFTRAPAVEGSDAVMTDHASMHPAAAAVQTASSNDAMQALSSEASADADASLVEDDSSDEDEEAQAMQTLLDDEAGMEQDADLEEHGTAASQMAAAAADTDNMPDSSVLSAASAANAAAAGRPGRGKHGIRQLSPGQVRNITWAMALFDHREGVHTTLKLLQAYLPLLHKTTSRRSKQQDPRLLKALSNLAASAAMLDARDTGFWMSMQQAVRYALQGVHPATVQVSCRQCIARNMYKSCFDMASGFLLC